MKNGGSSVNNEASTDAIDAAVSDAQVQQNAVSKIHKQGRKLNSGKMQQGRKLNSSKMQQWRKLSF